MPSLRTWIAAGALAWCLAPAQAGPIQLRFENLTIPIDGIRQPVIVDAYYNGGQVKATSDSLDKSVTAGSSVGQPGPDLDVVVTGSSTWALESSASGTGSFSSAGLDLGTGALALLERGSALVQLVDPTTSFDGALSFYFAAARDRSLTVTATGAGSSTQAKTFTFAGTQNCADATLFCHWQLAVFDLGTLTDVTSVRFEGTGVLLDNITLGSANPDTIPAIPEPATYALMAFGLAAVALTARRRSRRA